MRNLKRALSLALAAIMLLGMMVMGTGAVSIDDFTDSDAVQNVEAVTLTSGLGIFQGRTDGSFDPTAPVTRAEMAVIICKILHGADVSPDNFTGTQQFTDVPAWAEGYVNMCSALGIIAGRGNGIFDPDTTVTTVEAATMLLKALGYYVTVNDALGADWDLEVTSRANALKLYGDLTLNMRAPLTRDNVAELVYNTLFAQMVAFNDYRGQYVKNTNRDVVVTAGTDDEANTLAYNTFKLYVAEGIVMANGYTAKALAQSTSNSAQTTVMFTDDTDLDKDGRKEYKEGDEFDFNASTSLNLIGHAVKVYYTYTKKAPVVYAITDQAALTAVIEYDNNTTRLAEAANDAGFKKNSILDVKPEDYYVNYAMDVTVEDASKYTVSNWSDGTSISGTHFNLSGKKLLLISNSGNLDLSGEYDYVIVLDQYLDVVKEVEEIRGDVEYVLKTTGISTHATNGDVNIPLYDDVSEDDFVVVTNIGLKDEVVVFYEANLVDATITRITGISNNNADARRITADGVVYIESSVWDNSLAGRPLEELLTRFVDVKDLEAETLVLDEFGEMVGITEAEKTHDYAYIAQYGEVHTTGSLNTDSQLTAHVYYFDADGNLVNGIFLVDKIESTDMANAPSNPKKLTAAEIQYVKNVRNSPTVKSPNKDNGQDFESGALGVWNVKIKDNGHIEISGAYQTQQSVHPSEDDVRLVQSHSTFVKNNYAVHDNAGPAAGLPANGSGNILYQNNSTVYFYVDGKYGPNYTGADDLDVSAFVGIKNAPGFTNDKTPGNDIGIQQVFAHLSSNKQLVTAVLVEDVEVYSSQVYYYNEGNYHYSSDGLTYELYDMDGNLVEKTYPKLKKTDAASKWDGFYLIKNDDIYPYNIDDIMVDTDHGASFGPLLQAPAYIGGDNLYAWSNGSNGTTETKKGDKTYYVVNDIAQYDEIVENFFGVVTPQGNIAENVKIVDACNSGLDTVAKVVRAIKELGDNYHSNLLISYTYNTDDYTIKSFFISKYDPDETEAPNIHANGNRYFNDTLTASFSGNTLTFNGGVYKTRNDVTPASFDSANTATGTTETVTYTIQRYNLLGEKVGEAITRRTNAVGGSADVTAGVFSDSITLASPNAFTYYEITLTVKWSVTSGGKTTTYTATETLPYVGI